MLNENVVSIIKDLKVAFEFQSNTTIRTLRGKEKWLNKNSEIEEGLLTILTQLFSIIAPEQSKETSGTQPSKNADEEIELKPALKILTDAGKEQLWNDMQKKFNALMEQLTQEQRDQIDPPQKQPTLYNRLNEINDYENLEKEISKAEENTITDLKIPETATTITCAHLATLKEKLPKLKAKVPAATPTFSAADVDKSPLGPGYVSRNGDKYEGQLKTAQTSEELENAIIEAVKDESYNEGDFYGKLTSRMHNLEASNDKISDYTQEVTLLGKVSGWFQKPETLETLSGQQKKNFKSAKIKFEGYAKTCSGLLQNLTDERNRENAAKIKMKNYYSKLNAEFKIIFKKCLKRVERFVSTHKYAFSDVEREYLLQWLFQYVNLRSGELSVQYLHVFYGQKEKYLDKLELNPYFKQCVKDYHEYGECKIPVETLQHLLAEVVKPAFAKRIEPVVVYIFELAAGKPCELFGKTGQNSDPASKNKAIKAGFFSKLKSLTVSSDDVGYEKKVAALCEVFDNLTDDVKEGKKGDAKINYKKSSAKEYFSSVMSNYCGKFLNKDKHSTTQKWYDNVCRNLEQYDKSSRDTSLLDYAECFNIKKNAPFTLSGRAAIKAKEVIKAYNAFIIEVKNSNSNEKA